MREIKFRVWDKSTSKMIHDVRLGEVAWMQQLKTSTAVPELVYMQYIGLNDKYGKDIYEGDILSASFDAWPPEDNFVVEFNDWEKAFVFNQPSDYGDGYSIEIMTFGDAVQNGWAFEIVGNIHENPELIK